MRVRVHNTLTLTSPSPSPSLRPSTHDSPATAGQGARGGGSVLLRAEAGGAAARPHVSAARPRAGDGGTRAPREKEKYTTLLKLLFC